MRLSERIKDRLLLFMAGALIGCTSLGWGAGAVEVERLGVLIDEPILRVVLLLVIMLGASFLAVGGVVASHDLPEEVSRHRVLRERAARQAGMLSAVVEESPAGRLSSSDRRASLSLSAEETQENGALSTISPGRAS